jgi:hypothetical protein
VLKRPDARVLDIATVCLLRNPLFIADNRARGCTSSPLNKSVDADIDRWAIEMADMFPQYVFPSVKLI